MEDYRKTKDKLLTKAFDKKEFNEGPKPGFYAGSSRYEDLLLI